MFKKDVVIAMSVYLVLMVILILVFDIRPPALAVIGIYILIYVVVSAVLNRRTQTEPEALQPEMPQMPTSGPIGRFGQTGLLLTFTVTGLLSLLNPFQLVQIILQAVGNIWLQSKAKSGDTENQLPANQTRYTLPVEGEWFVYNGGVSEKTSHSWDVLTQRYAYDFVQVDEQMKRHSGEGTSLTEYYCFGKNIVAAAEGTVVKVVDRVRSAPFVGYGVVDFLATNFVGNHVIIQHTENEFGLYAHLIKGTIPVNPGERVQRGQVIGQCGHSGHSSEPHLHFHLQDGPNFYFAMGLPIRFSDVMVEGAEPAQVYLEAGSRVKQHKKKDSPDGFPDSTSHRNEGLPPLPGGGA